MRLGADLCRSWMSDAAVARLATVRPDGRPHLVPITFAWLEPDLIVTAVDHKPKSTRQLSRLDNIRANPHVSVLADHYSNDWRELWWVRADGEAAITDSGDEWQWAIAALCAKYEQYQSKVPDGPVIVIAVNAWNGWSALS